LKALLEGTVFNHKGHVDTLRSGFEFTRVRLTGGGSRSALWSQMFADALDLTVEVTDAGETGALGAAVCSRDGDRRLRARRGRRSGSPPSQDTRA
jgi:L-xylulokinase